MVQLTAQKFQLTLSVFQRTSTVFALTLLFSQQSLTMFALTLLLSTLTLTKVKQTLPWFKQTLIRVKLTLLKVKQTLIWVQHTFPVFELKFVITCDPLWKFVVILTFLNKVGWIVAFPLPFGKWKKVYTPTKTVVYWNDNSLIKAKQF